MSTNTKIVEQFGDVAQFRYCEQCGRCASACPITGVDGFNIRRIVRHIELGLIDEIARTPLPWLCTTCGRCEDACPNGIKIIDITRKLRTMVPDKYFPPEGARAPCVTACPAGIDIPGYLRLIGEERWDDAYNLIMERAPFPGVLGRICVHPCESICKRGKVFDQPISICASKRYIADHAVGANENTLKVAPDTGKKVAVIGSGPAGLTAAFLLRKKGHAVTVFEAREKLGGMMRYGIPRYRLPEEVLDKEIDQVLSVGIDTAMGTKFGDDMGLDKLKKDGFDAVFIAVGAQLSRQINLEGKDFENVDWGVDFLTAVNGGKDVAVKERVMVVGGGNVAIDVAMTALRLGAKEVKLACLESREEMPANEWEIEMAQAEGVEMHYSWGPNKVLANNGAVAGVELVRCTSVFNEAGNFCPYFDDTKKTLEADQLILAIGQACDLGFCDLEGHVLVNGNMIAIDKETQETGVEGIFAGGDAANGPGAVIDAIAAGRRAAASIDQYLGGDGVIGNDYAPLSIEAYHPNREKGFAELKREIPAHSSLEERKGFEEVERCFADEQVKKEAHRCFQCDMEVCMARAARAAAASS